MSFIRKISQKNNEELISKTINAFVSDGVYILHETLGVRMLEGWNPKNNNGVIGILFIEDDHKIVIALEDSPKNLHWSMKHELINQPVKKGKTPNLISMVSIIVENSILRSIQQLIIV